MTVRGTIQNGDSADLARSQSTVDGSAIRDGMAQSSNPAQVVAALAGRNTFDSRSIISADAQRGVVAGTNDGMLIGNLGGETVWATAAQLGIAGGGGGAPAAHALTHSKGGTDQVSLIDMYMSYTPVNYSAAPDATIAGYHVNGVDIALGLRAPKANPTFTGVVTIPTAGSLTSPYQKTEVDTLLAAKAPIISPLLSGIPTAPTAAAGTNTTQVATMAAVQTATGSASSNRPVGRIYQSVAQSVPTSVWTLMTYDVSATDTDSMTGVSHRVKATTPGTYQINSNVAFGTNATGVRGIRLAHRNSAGTLLDYYGAVNVPNNGAGSPTELSTSAGIVMAAGDYVQTELFQASGAPLPTAVVIGTSSSSRCMLAAEWVGGTGAAWGNANGMVVRNSLQAIPTSAWTDVIFNQVIAANDVTGAASTQPLTAQVSGKYAVGTKTAWVNTAAGGSRLTRVVHKNAAGTIKDFYAQTTAPGSVNHYSVTSGFADIPMDAGDFLQLQVFQDSGAPLNTSQDNSLYHMTISMNRVGYQTNPSKMGSRVPGGFQEATTDYTTDNGTSLTITVTHDGITPIRLTAYGYCTNTTAARLCGFKIMDGATVVQNAASIRVPAAGMNMPVQISRVVAAQPAGTVKTYTVVNASDVGSVPTIYGTAGGRYIEATWAG